MKDLLLARIDGLKRCVAALEATLGKGSPEKAPKKAPEPTPLEATVRRSIEEHRIRLDELTRLYEDLGGEQAPPKSTTPDQDELDA